MGSITAHGNKVTFPLNTGAEIPAVGLGTWKAEPGKMKEVIRIALEDAGYRHIDCAAAYENEEEIGEAFKEVFSRGKVKREDVFITSKLWVTHAQPSKVGKGLDETLSRLQLEYLDLYLIHWPISLHVEASQPFRPEDYIGADFQGTWHSMEAQMAAGKTKAIGVSNFSTVKLELLLSSCLVRPAVNQIELHPAWRNDKIVNFCKSKGIHPSGYSPLGTSESLVVDSAKGDEETTLLKHSAVVEIANKLGKSPGQILIRWGVQRETAVIPKSTNLERIRENIDVFDWELSEEDFKKLSSLEPQQKAITGEGMFFGIGGPYKTKEDLWDGEI